MMAEFVTLDVHREFEKRIEGQLDELSSQVRQISDLVTSVRLLANNIETMAQELRRQGERLSEIERKPAQHWETVVTGLLAAIVGALGAAIAGGIFR